MIFRAFYAISPLTSPKGTPTNAIFGVLTMLERVFKEKKPDYICACFDSKKPSFRAELYQEYKANRDKPPEDLGVQIPLIRELVEKMGIAVIQQEGIEADDLIATLVQKTPQFHHTIVSSDKDLFQLVGQSTVLWDSMKGVTYGEKEVFEKLGVTCAQVRDYLALVGDSSDNIPGVKSVGPKTATAWLAEFGSLKGIYENLDKLPQKKQELLRAEKDMADLSYLLVGLKFLDDLELPSTLDTPKTFSQDFISFLKELGFTKVISRFPTGSEQSETPATATSSQSIPTNSANAPQVKTPNANTLQSFVYDEKLFSSLHGKKIALYPLVSSENDEAYGVVVTDGSSWSYSSWKELAQIRLDEAAQLTAWESKIFYKSGTYNKSWHDLELLAYLFEEQKLDIEYLAEKYDLKLNHVISIPDALNSTCPADILGDAVNKAYAYQKLLAVYQEKLPEAGLEKVYSTVDQPLVKILALMEKEGILLDVTELRSQEKKLKIDLQEISEKIFSISGEHFNLDSPKQVSFMFFEKMGLPVIRKTKTGYSTDAEVLEELAPSFPIAALLLQYRELAKLLSTYVSAIPEMVNLQTGRLHTTFNQTVAATGRLSSQNPNLQNIPIRTSQGREVRKAFIADPGHVLVSADYSQIELRVLAHYTKDPGLVRAFSENRDIHEETARAIFGGLHDPTNDQRRIAKTINFGLMYGQGAMGLSRQLGISFGQGKQFIDQYFKAFPSIQKWMEQTISQATIKGYVETLLGRRRHIPELKSQNGNIRKMGGRIAINTPIQGTAADLIKLAMVSLFPKLKPFGAKLLLQVHDELILEVDQNHGAAVQELLVKTMEEAFPLDVPVKVDSGIGKNWFELGL